MPPYYGENHETAAAFLSLAANVLGQVSESLSRGFRDGKFDSDYTYLKSMHSPLATMLLKLRSTLRYMILWGKMASLTALANIGG
jgi:hypothetical protein